MHFQSPKKRSRCSARCAASWTAKSCRAMTTSSASPPPYCRPRSSAGFLGRLKSSTATVHDCNAKHAPAMLEQLRQAAIENRDAFDVLMDAVRVCLLGQVTGALFHVGGQYRRNM